MDETISPLDAVLGVIAVMFITFFVTLAITEQMDCTEYKVISRVVRIEEFNQTVEFEDGTRTTEYSKLNLNPGTEICTEHTRRLVNPFNDEVLYEWN